MVLTGAAVMVVKTLLPLDFMSSIMNERIIFLFSGSILPISEMIARIFVKLSDCRSVKYFMSAFSNTAKRVSMKSFLSSNESLASQSTRMESIISLERDLFSSVTSFFPRTFQKKASCWRMLNPNNTDVAGVYRRADCNMNYAYDKGSFTGNPFPTAEYIGESDIYVRREKASFKKSGDLIYRQSFNPTFDADSRRMQNLLPKSVRAAISMRAL